MNRLRWAGTAAVILLAVLPVVAQDDAVPAAGNTSPPADQSSEDQQSELKSVVAEIRSLRKLLQSVRSDVASLRDALKQQPADRGSRPKPYDVNAMPEDRVPVRVPARQSLLFDQGRTVARIAIADPKTIDIVQFTPTQFALVGMKPGKTTLTVWFDHDRDPLIMLVEVYESDQPTASVDLSHSPQQSHARREIEQALDSQASIDALDEPLIDVIRGLRESSEINFVLDVPAIEREGVTTNTSVSLKLSGITLRSALRILLSDLNLAWVIEDGAIRITSAAQAADTFHVEAYRVGKLLVADEAKEQQLDRLIELVQSTIAPDTWDTTGGQGTIKSFPVGDSLVVRQDQAIHHRIALLFQSMARLINRPVSSSEQSKLFQPGASGFHLKATIPPALKQLQTMSVTQAPVLKNPTEVPGTTSIRPSDGRPMRLGGVRPSLRATTDPPQVQLSSGRYVELQEPRFQKYTVATIVRRYEPSPTLMQMLSGKGSSDTDQLKQLIERIQAVVNPDSWKSDYAQAGVLFGDRIVIRHTAGTHDRIRRLLERLEAEAQRAYPDFRRIYDPPVR